MLMMDTLYKWYMSWNWNVIPLHTWTQGLAWPFILMEIKHFMRQIAIRPGMFLSSRFRQLIYECFFSPDIKTLCKRLGPKTKAHIIDAVVNILPLAELLHWGTPLLSSAQVWTDCSDHLSYHEVITPFEQHEKHYSSQKLEIYYPQPNWYYTANIWAQ